MVIARNGLAKTYGNNGCELLATVMEKCATNHHEPADDQEEVCTAIQRSIFPSFFSNSL